MGAFYVQSDHELKLVTVDLKGEPLPHIAFMANCTLFNTL